jgi:hypothetical protein
VAGSREYGDEPSGSGSMELVIATDISLCKVQVYKGLGSSMGFCGAQCVTDFILQHTATTEHNTHDRIHVTFHTSLADYWISRKIRKK